VVKEKIFFAGPTRAATIQDNNLLYGYDKSIEPTKEEPLSFVLFESPFPSVSRGHPYLASLVSTEDVLL
jgi:hypothetical protein